MKEIELWELLVSLSGNEINLSEAHELILRLFDVSGSLSLADLEKRLDEVLDKETPETLNKWSGEKRK